MIGEGRMDLVWSSRTWWSPVLPLLGNPCWFFLECSALLCSVLFCALMRLVMAKEREVILTLKSEVPKNRKKKKKKKKSHEFTLEPCYTLYIYVSLYHVPREIILAHSKSNHRQWEIVLYFDVFLSGPEKIQRQREIVSYFDVSLSWPEKIIVNEKSAIEKSYHILMSWPKISFARRTSSSTRNGQSK